MKVAMLSTYDFGGAGTATRRIHDGLRRIGTDSQMFVNIKKGDEWHIHGPQNRVREALAMARFVADLVPLKLHGGADGPFSLNWVPSTIFSQIKTFNPDVVHLNWVGDGYMNPASVAKFDSPLVWRLPDMWAFTGGCHYADGCYRYTDSCGMCPKLGSNRGWDLSHWTWWRKARAWRDDTITVVAPSTWLAEQAAKSSLFSERRIEVIPNGLDTTVFRPIPPAQGRRSFALPQDRRLILFGAQAVDDPRKGIGLLRRALELLRDQGSHDDVDLVIFGSSRPEEPPDFAFETHYTGYVHDDATLASLYAACDVMVVPSKFEAFGQTVTESMACGTPVVGFDATGPQDTIEHGQTGYLAEPYDTDDLAEGIGRVLDASELRTTLGEQARMRAVEQYDIETVAHQYHALYEDILA